MFDIDSPVAHWLKCNKCNAVFIRDNWLIGRQTFHVTQYALHILIPKNKWGESVSDEQAAEFSKRLCQLIFYKTKNGAYAQLGIDLSYEKEPVITLSGNLASIHILIEHIGKFINDHWRDTQILDNHQYDPGQHHKDILIKNGGYETVPVFLDCGGDAEIYCNANQTEKKSMCMSRYNIYRQALEHNIHMIAERDILKPRVGVMRLGPYTEFWAETTELHIYGHFYSCIVFAGFTIERICNDLIRTAKIVYNGHEYLREEKSEKERLLNKLKLEQGINLLSQNNVINKMTADKMHEIRKLRNDYAHAKDGLCPDKDSVKAVGLLCEVIQSIHTIRVA
jgi:hypothetical protein